MSERDALIAAIKANPLEETPRLVFADWLDDHDENDLAKAVRLFVEAGRIDVRPVLLLRDVDYGGLEFTGRLTYGDKILDVPNIWEKMAKLVHTTVDFEIVEADTEDTLHTGTGMLKDITPEVTEYTAGNIGGLLANVTVRIVSYLDPKVPSHWLLRRTKESLEKEAVGCLGIGWLPRHDMLRVNPSIRY